MSEQHDLIILGSGTTAFAAALRATSHGARVLLCEKSVLGGTCINWGCIPSKTLIHASLFRHEAHIGKELGLRVSGGHGRVDFGRLSDHRERVVLKLRQERYLDVLRQMPGLELIKGTMRFRDRKTVEVGEQTYRAERFLVAVGGNPRVPVIPGLEKINYLTSRTALLLREMPKSLLIVGGGVIAVELGQMYQRLGCQVTILEHGPRLLPGVEAELSQVIHEVLRSEGLNVALGVNCCSVERAGELTVVHGDQAGQPVTFAAERLLVAVGTSPATAGIGLENAGVDLDHRGFIVTDEFMRTSAAGIWAAGDVTGRVQIATVGARQGIVAVDSMFDQGCACAMDYLKAPMAIFTDPEVGMVGYGEAEARQVGWDVMVNSMPASAIPKAHVTGNTVGMIKMVADRTSGRLLGVHLACHRGAELINEAGLALHLRATVQDLASTMHVYPSIGEGLKLCAQGFTRDLSKLSCCAE